MTHIKLTESTDARNARLAALARKTQHAETPKKLYLADGRVWEEGTGINVCNFEGCGNPKLYAPFIVRAVNSHDQLVTALKLARAEITALEGRKPTDTDNSIVREINAAIAKAGAE